MHGERSAPSQAAEIGKRIAGAIAGDEDALRELYHPDVVYRTPLEALAGRDAVLAALAELREGFPGLRVALHDAFGDASGQRACVRLRLDWASTGRFRGREPTGRSGTAVETHSLRLDGGRVVQQIAGVSTFQLAQLLLAEWRLDFPRELDDPERELLGATPGDPARASAGDSLARRFTDAFGRRDTDGLEAIYAEDVELYTPLGWPVRGREALLAFVDQFHAANPGMRVALHDEFYDATGTRACWRVRLHFHNTGPFYGLPPTGDRGAMTETHSLTLRDGRIERHVVGDNSFHMPYQELVEWRMDFPTDTPDPDPEIAAAGP